MDARNICLIKMIHLKLFLIHLVVLSPAVPFWWFLQILELRVFSLIPSLLTPLLLPWIWIQNVLPVNIGTLEMNSYY